MKLSEFIEKNGTTGESTHMHDDITVQRLTKSSARTLVYS